MTQFKAMKFRVESPAHAEKTLNKLFEMGYDWDIFVFDEWQPPYHFIKYLYTYECGKIIWGEMEDTFLNKPHQEMQLVEIYDFVPVPKSTPEKDVVVFDGKEYDKEQFKGLLKEALDSL